MIKSFVAIQESQVFIYAESCKEAFFRVFLCELQICHDHSLQHDIGWQENIPRWSVDIVEGVVFELLPD